MKIFDETQEGQRVAIRVLGIALGTYWRTPYGWFCDPLSSQLAAIPCEDVDDCRRTILRLGPLPSLMVTS